MNDSRLLALLICGAMIGAAQLTVLWGFLPDDIVPNQNAAGWILLIAPAGTLSGILFTAILCRVNFIKLWKILLVALLIGNIVGFQAALTAPLLLECVLEITQAF